MKKDCIKAIQSFFSLPLVRGNVGFADKRVAVPVKERLYAVIEYTL